jgi:23S rRNA (cytosine1962-C5)-methyltransferase
MTRIRLKKNEDRRIRGGHPWVFSNEIGQIDGERQAGCAAELFDAAGGFLGCGYYTPHSLIAFRLLSRKREELDAVPFYEQRIAASLAHRTAIYPGLRTFRAVYGESDFLPGLVVDRYEGYLSLQMLSAGMDIRRDLIVEALQRVFAQTVSSPATTCRSAVWKDWRKGSRSWPVRSPNWWRSRRTVCVL